MSVLSLSVLSCTGSGGERHAAESIRRLLCYTALLNASTIIGISIFWIYFISNFHSDHDGPMMNIMLSFSDLIYRSFQLCQTQN